MCRFAKKNILLYQIILRMSFRISLDIMMLVMQIYTLLIKSLLHLPPMYIKIVV